MAKMKICKKCGLINSIDDMECEYCNENLELNSKRLDVSKDVKEKFCDYTQSPVCYQNEPLVKLNSLNKKAENSFPTEQREKTKKEVYVKICPLCGCENDEDASECTDCGLGTMSLIEKTKKQEINNEDVEEILEDIIEEEYDYYIDIGVSGTNNIVPVIFNDKNQFVIGRDYQECLRDNFTVSRYHCYISKLLDNRYAIFESKNYPSTNHTYILKNGVKIQLEPGKGRPIGNGDSFYITKNIRVMFRKKV